MTGIHGARTLRAFGRGQVALQPIDARSRIAVTIGVDVFRLYTRFGTRMNGSELVGLLLVLSSGFFLVQADAVTVGAATTAALFFHRLFKPIGALLFVFDQVQSSGAAVARLAGVVMIDRPEGEGDEPGPEPVLRVSGLRHEYDADRPVLHGIDLVVGPGERVAVVGATGAGKSTLGGVVARTVHATAGSVHLGTLDLARADESVVRRHVAIVS